MNLKSHSLITLLKYLPLQLLAAIRDIFSVPPWLRLYQPKTLSQDLLAGLIVGILVIPQSLGYAVLSGLPAVYGLYSAIVPVIVYAWVGSSNVNAVGPVAITAIMTAQALAGYQHLAPADYALMASFLALMTGAILWLASVLKLGFLTQFISRGVRAGFISGAAILILVGQIKYITGISIGGNTLPAQLQSIYLYRHELHLPTLLLGLAAFIILLLNRYRLKAWLSRIVSTGIAATITKVMPLVVLIVSIIASFSLDFHEMGIRTIIDVPSGLPSFTTPFYPLSLDELIDLLPAAALMALIAFVSSDSVAASMARKQGEKYQANRELAGLGLANIVGAFFQSLTVVGGFSRTAVNVDAGAKSPLASVASVIVMALVLMYFSQLLAPLPYAILGATIMAAIISMIDIQTLKSAIKSDPIDAIAFLAALLGVLIFGLNVGLVAGLLASFAGLIWQLSHPHIAVVGQVGSTAHFRNNKRHQVTLHGSLVIIRIDESLFYGNSEQVEHFILKAVNENPACQHLLLMLSAVNHIDLTAQDMLIDLNSSLSAHGITLHFSEVKGPVMDIIADTAVIKSLSGQVFLSTMEAVNTLTHETDANSQSTD